MEAQLMGVGSVLLSYLLGSLPVGLLVVRWTRGVDVRGVGSGRVGTTNVVRAAGAWAGILTGALDLLKGLAAGWIAGWMVPGNQLVHALSVAAAVLGQIHSIFLPERTEAGKLRLRGGAGGMTSFGAVASLAPLPALGIGGVALMVYFVVGYASLTTIAIALLGFLFFAYQAVAGAGPWEYVLFGALDLALVLWALRPNIARLKQGTERTVGLRAAREKKRNAQKGQQMNPAKVRPEKIRTT